MKSFKARLVSVVSDLLWAELHGLEWENDADMHALRPCMQLLLFVLNRFGSLVVYIVGLLVKHFESVCKPRVSHVCPVWTVLVSSFCFVSVKVKICWSEWNFPPSDPVLFVCVSVAVLSFVKCDKLTEVSESLHGFWVLTSRILCRFFFPCEFVSCMRGWKCGYHLLVRVCRSVTMRR